jgi:hypothetical protein
VRIAWALEVIFAGKRNADLADDHHGSQVRIAAIIAGERVLAHRIGAVGAVAMIQADAAALRRLVVGLQATAIPVADGAAVIPVEPGEPDRLPFRACNLDSGMPMATPLSSCQRDP